MEKKVEKEEEEKEDRRIGGRLGKMESLWRRGRARVVGDGSLEEEGRERTY